jgi:hypothetical protein
MNIGSPPRLRLIAATAAVTLCAIAGIAPAQQPTSQPASTEPAEAPAMVPPAAADARVGDVLAKAKLLDREKVSAEFHRLLQSVGDDLVPVQTGTTFGRARWQTITLNRFGVGFDAIRFRAPNDKSRGMLWAFLIRARDLHSWYIIPATAGRMDGFDIFTLDYPQRYEGFDWPKRTSLVWQDLPASSLKPGEQYIIWFQFPHGRPVKVELAITFLEPRDGADPVLMNDVFGVERLDQAMGVMPPPDR